jgi:putative transposase
MLHNPLMHTSHSLYHRHRFPAEIISHCVWLYFRFPLSFRDVEEMLAMRGVSLGYETVREWCLKFGQTYANGLRRSSSRPWRLLAPRRGIPKNQRTPPLPLACG